MNISELIAKLEIMRNKFGDVPVEVRNSDGEWNFADRVMASIGGKPGEERWGVHVDSP